MVSTRGLASSRGTRAETLIRVEDSSSLKSGYCQTDNEQATE